MGSILMVILAVFVLTGIAAVPGGAAPHKWDIGQWRSTKLDSNPVWLSPSMSIDSKELKWLSVRAKSVDSTQGMVYWSNRGSDRKCLFFHMKPDGVTRTYSVNLGSSSDWAGQINTLGLGMPKEKRVEFLDAELLAQPIAPPEIEATFFDLRDMVNKADHECVLHAVIRNIGGKPATNFKVSTVVGDQKLPPIMVASLGINESTTISWPFKLRSPGRYQAVMEITGGGMPITSVRNEIAIAPSLMDEPFISGDGRPYVPKPAKVAGDYDIGVYYYPGWSSYTNWSVLDNYPEKRPALGYYREGDPEVADWHIKWAAEHGITFFIYDWYWQEGDRHSEHALQDGYLKSHYQSEVKFALLWANHNQPGTSSDRDLMQVTGFWLDNYFKLPNYYKVDGKPVVIIFSPDRLTQDMGVENVKDAFLKMRSMARLAGIPDLYIMACTGPDSKALKVLKEEGYDAATGYNYPSAGSSNPLNAPYDLAINGYATIWRQIANAKLLTCVPVTDPGWDSRPWAGEQALNRTGRSPDKFKLMLEKAKGFVDEQVPLGNPKMVLVEAWNEFGEGAAIEPSKEFGFGYLDAVRAVFAGAPSEHTDVTPEDSGLGPYGLTPPPPGYVWDFKSAVGSLGWGKQNMNPFTVSDGALRGISTNQDPGLYSPKFKLDSRTRSTLTVNMRIGNGEQAQIFWSTTDKSISEATSLRFEVIPDNGYHTYTIELSDSMEWDGTITQIRLDPCDARDADIAVGYIRID